MSKVHADVPTPFQALLRAEYLYNLEERHGELEPVRVIGVSSYADEVLTFDIQVLSNGGLFHYIPPSALVFGAQAPSFELRDLVYHNCPGADIAVFELTALKEQRAHLKAPKDRALGDCEGEYLFTVDWYEDNALCHVLKLDNGALAVYPSHKVLFGEAGEGAELPKWKKLRAEFSV